MRIFAAIVFSIGIFLAGFYWHKTHHEVVELSLDIGFRSLQRLAFDEVSQSHLAELVRAELTIKGRQTPVLLEALSQQENKKLSAIKVTVDEKDAFEPRHMLLIVNDVVMGNQDNELMRELQLQVAPLYINGKRVSQYALITEPFFKLVAVGQGPIARRVNGVIELSYQSKQLPIMSDILQREASKFPKTTDETWWYWNKEKWVKFGSWPAGWPL
ncbi:MAG: hypothetical protein ACLGG0_07575 [Bacteriovoracia bacterium]